MVLRIIKGFMFSGREWYRVSTLGNLIGADSRGCGESRQVSTDLTAKSCDLPASELASGRR